MLEVEGEARAEVEGDEVAVEGLAGLEQGAFGGGAEAENVVVGGEGAETVVLGGIG